MVLDSRGGFWSNRAETLAFGAIFVPGMLLYWAPFLFYSICGFIGAAILIMAWLVLVALLRVRDLPLHAKDSGSPPLS